MRRDFLQFGLGRQRVESSRTTVGINLAVVSDAGTAGSNVFQSQTARRTDVKRKYHSGTKPIAPDQLGTLIDSFSGRVRLLDGDIEAEEERTQCRDRRDPAYSFLARTLIARRDNLSATIAALRERLATLEAPEWNYS